MLGGEAEEAGSDEEVDDSADPEGEITFCPRNDLLLAPLLLLPVPLSPLADPLPLPEPPSEDAPASGVGATAGSAEEEREPGLSEEEPDSFELDTSSFELGDSVLDELSLEPSIEEPADRDWRFDPPEDDWLLSN